MIYTPQNHSESRRIALEPIILALTCIGLGNYFLGSKDVWLGIALLGTYSLGYWVGYIARTKDEPKKPDLSWAITADTMRYTTSSTDSTSTLDSKNNVSYHYDPSFV